MKRVLMATAVSTHALLGAAFAQEAEAPRRLEPVMITSAPGPDRASDELIGNATALERDDIVRDLSSTLGDTLAGEPGITSTFFGQGASRPVLRGLGAERVQVLTNGIGVIDVSAASPDHQVTADGIDADKIEILRGPAALAYGGQAIGGVVNVIDGLISESLPEATVSGDAFGAYNSVNEGTELAGRAKFVTGPIVFAVTASQRDFGNYDVPGFVESARLRALEEAEEPEVPGEEHEESIGQVENSHLDTETYGAGLSWVGDRGFAGIAIRSQQATYGLPGHAHEEEAPAPGDPPAEEELPFIGLEQTRYDFRAGLNLDGAVLKRVTGSVALADYTHTEFEGPGEPGTLFETSGIEARAEIDHEIAGFQGAFGLQLLDKELFTEGDEAFITPTDTRSVAVFLYEAREWDSGFGVEGGLRAERLKHDNSIAGEAEFDLFGASAGLHQHTESGYFMGVQISYTERAPNESELFAFGPHLATSQFEVGDLGLEKERGLNLEGTLRWKNDWLSLGVNVFTTKFSDFIFLTPGTIDEGLGPVDEADGLPVFVFAQDDATFTGGELYGEALFDDGLLGANWTVKGGLDFVNAELDNNGNVPFVPPLRLTAEADAEWGLLELGAGLEWAGDQDETGAGQLPTDGYTLVNLRGALNLSELGIGADGTQVFVEVRNATDEEARVSTSVLKDLLPLPGRNVRAGLRLTF
ncbi:TonB-dependent receptor [Hyphomonas sp.]|uniref:TonB-dependent receptor n=1 Tax=Hyphomonas sp. TaxID=87 RepID=UPI000AF0D2BA|nr:TonB-dependent receptor [Hyphomonas sp.]